MRKLLLLIAFLCYIGSSFAQTTQHERRVNIYFKQAGFEVNPDFPYNREAIEDIVNYLKKIEEDSLCTVSRITINSSTSPEGGVDYNMDLSSKRTASILDYMINELQIPADLIQHSYSGIAWDRLRELILNTPLEYRYEVADIIDNVPEETWARVNPDDKWLTLVDSRNKHLMDLRGGEVYQFIYNNFYPVLRRGSVVTIYTHTLPPWEYKDYPDSVPVEQPRPTPVERETEVLTKPILAVKTNLLFDLMTAVNIEVEVPIGNHWSVAGEWIFPWWTSCGNKKNSWQSSSSSHRNTLEVLNGNIEGKYWFGDRTDRLALTGWHVGLYAGGGKYDLEYHAEGYQGEFFIAAGLSGGYAHTIFENWVPDGNFRMEYSVAIGYLKTDYRYYEEHWGIDDTWHTLRQNNGTYTWFGPTRARVSLVWMFNRKIEKEK